MVNFHKVISFIMLVSSLYFSKAEATFTLEKEYGWTTRSFILHKLPSQEEDRKQFISSIFEASDVTVYDLSETDLKDNDAQAILEGLFKRAVYVETHKYVKGIQLLNVGSESFTTDGVERLLKGLQHGDMHENKKIYPDVCGTILKVSSEVDVTEELQNRWYRMFPSVFSGGLRIIE